MIAEERAMILFFTWNVNHNLDAMKLACEHLARAGSCVAAFQEAPDVDAATVAAWSGGNLSLLDATASGATKVIFIASADLSLDPTGRRHQLAPTLDANCRLEGLTLLSGAGTRFQVLGVHGLDRVNYRSAEDRVTAGGLLRRVIDSFWTGDPLVVLGDLQSNPFDREITHRTGLHALRKKDFPDGELNIPQTNVPVKPLYNPMWPLLLDEAGGAKGTYHFRGATDLFWHCIDQIIVSLDLAPHLGKPEILTALQDAARAGQDLVTAHGLPNDKKYSDHLPVQMTVNIDQVKP